MALMRPNTGVAVSFVLRAVVSLERLKNFGYAYSLSEINQIV